MKKKKLWFFKKVYHLLAAGLKLRKVLEGLSETDKANGHEYRLMLQQLDDGQDFAQVVKQYFKVSSVEESLLEAAQHTGTIKETLRTMVEYGVRNSKFASEIRKATLRPIITLFFALLVLVGVTTVAVPKMLQNLPTKTTPVILVVLNYFGKLIPYIFGSGMIIAFVFISLFYLSPFRFWQFVYDLPIVGTIRRHNSIFSLFLTLSILCNGGVKLIDALKLVEKNYDPYFKEIVAYIIAKTENGVSLQESFADIDVFPFYIVEIVEMAEKRGDKYGEFFKEAAILAEEDFHESKNTLLPLIEYGILITIAVVVIITLMSVIIPVQQMGQAAFSGKGL